MSVFFLTSLSSLSVSAPPQQHTQTHIISLILPLLSILTLWCSGLSCKVLQISIRRRVGMIHMFMRTGVCQSQGQVAHPRECVHVCVCVSERDLIPHLPCLYLYPYPHLGSISLESAHNIKCSNTFTNTRAHTHARICQRRW